MSMRRIRYGILDDFGEVVRWVWDKPSPKYLYITQRIKRENAYQNAVTAVGYAPF